MKVFFAHATDHSFKNEAYRAIRDSHLNAKHAITLPQEQGFQPPMPREIIIAHEILIAECSYPSTGKGIELGWCHSAGIPILCLYNEKYAPSGSLKNVASQIAIYKDYEEMVQKMEEFIQKYEKKN